MIKATPADRPAIEAFLRVRIATSMFPLSNLARHGMQGGHPRAVTFWTKWQQAALTDVLAMSDEGILFPQCTTAPWGDAKVVMAGQTVKGLLGDSEQVAALVEALNLSAKPALHHVEPLYTLSLDQLRMPEVDGFSIAPLAEAPDEVVIGWRGAYLKEVLPVPGQDDDKKAAQEIANYREAGSHFVLLEGETPVAMTGFNAILSDAVQIGGVFVPPAGRSRGLARRAVALHLAQARSEGIKTACLFAASPQAARAYEAVGFVRCGDFTILTYQEPQVVYG